MMKKLLLIMIFVFSLSGCSAQYEGWKEIELQDYGSIKVPEGWTYHIQDNEIYFVDEGVTEGCFVDGKLKDSILFSDVTVCDGAELNFSVVMSNTKIGKNAKINYAIIADDAIIEDGAVVGAAPEDVTDMSKWGIAVVGQGARVKAGQTVLPGEMIEPGGIKE